MKFIAFLILLFPLSIIGQNYGLVIYPEHNGKIISQIISKQDSKYAVLVPFLSDNDDFEESNVCEINELNKLVNCKKLTDSCFYWNIILSYDSTSYIFAGVKTSGLFKIDSLLIEKRDLDFNLLQRIAYPCQSEPLTLPILKDGISYHIFFDLVFEDDKNLYEYVIPSDNDLTKIKLKLHDINNNVISSIKAYGNSFLALFLSGLALTDTSFTASIYLKDNIVYNQGSIIDAIDSGFIAFGSAAINNDPNKLGIIKYNMDLIMQKSDTFGAGIKSFEKPAVSIPLTKNFEYYYVSANIGIDPDFYNNHKPNFFFVGKYDKTLDRKWLKKIGGDRSYLVWGLESTENGGCYIYGLTRSIESNFESIPFIMYIDENGSVTSIEEQIPSYLDFTLLGNPGGNELKFNLEGSSSSFSYQVANLNGQIVSRGIGNPGINIVSSNSWPAGVYVISFTNNGTLIHSEKWVKAN